MKPSPDPALPQSKTPRSASFSHGSGLFAAVPRLSAEEIQEKGGFPVDISATSPYWQAPAPIAYATIQMMEEKLINSTDELIHLLEVWLRHLGWLWIVEYLHAPDQDRRVDQLLFQWLLEGHRELSVGAWAYLGSTLSHLFRERRWPTFVPNIGRFEYGDPHDANSPLSRLLRYRNSFAHGSFSAVIQDILEHRRLFWELLSPLDQLRDARLLCRHPEGQGWVLANGLWERVEPPPEVSAAEERGSCYLWLPDKPPLDLSRCFQVRTQSHSDLGPLELKYFSIHKAKYSERVALFSHQDHTRKHLEEYQAMRQGILEFEWSTEALPQLPPEQLSPILAQLSAALDKRQAHRPQVVTVVGYPGSGKSGLLAQSLELFEGFDACFLYRIRHDDLTISATTCARYFVRQLSSWLDTDTSQLEHSDDILTCLNEALQAVGASGKRVLLGIDQFHLAYRPYRNEDLRIADLLLRLAPNSGQNVVLMLTARPGYRDDLLGDDFLQLPIVEYAKEEKYEGLLDELGLEQRESSQGLTPEQVRFRRALLFLLGSAPRPLTPFELSDVVERLWQQRPELFPKSFVFTPQVERALWELRPLLQWERFLEEDEDNVALDPFETQRYAPFCQHFGQWLRRALMP